MAYNLFANTIFQLQITNGYDCVLCVFYSFVLWNNELATVTVRKYIDYGEIWNENAICFRILIGWNLENNRSEQHLEVFSKATDK